MWLVDSAFVRQFDNETENPQVIMAAIEIGDTHSVGLDGPAALCAGLRTPHTPTALCAGLLTPHTPTALLRASPDPAYSNRAVRGSPDPAHSNRAVRGSPDPARPGPKVSIAVTWRPAVMRSARSETCAERAARRRRSDWLSRDA